MTDRPSLTERDLKVAQILRPLGTQPLSMQQAKVASQLLGVHWTSIYRLRRRFLLNPLPVQSCRWIQGPRWAAPG